MKLCTLCAHKDIDCKKSMTAWRFWPTKQTASTAETEQNGFTILNKIQHKVDKVKPEEDPRDN